MGLKILRRDPGSRSARRGPARPELLEWVGLWGRRRGGRGKPTCMHGTAQQADRAGLSNWARQAYMCGARID